MDFETRMLIDGELVTSQDGSWLESINPADESVIGRVPNGSARDMDAAVAAAKRAQPSWGALDMAERASALLRVAAKLESQDERVLQCEIADTGNTIRKLRGDVSKAVRMIRYYAGLGLELKGETVPATAQNIHFSLREPYGVVGRIIPFNHPIQFAASRLAAPLMAGNTLVIKPSESSPLSAGILSEICQSELPAGVVNVVTGLGSTAGDALVRHPDVRRIAFIGSVATGMAIQRAAAEVGVKHISLELGGKNPMIVFPDAALEDAIPAAINGMNFAWSGQSCGSTSRLFLHDDIYDQAVEEIRARVEALQVGDPIQDRSDMGPLNSQAQYDKVQHYISAGKEDGGRLLTGGNRPVGVEFERGFWVRPTVFADVTPAMRIFSEEIFGPVLSVIRWRDYDNLMKMVNGVQYGLTASIWTNDLKVGMRAAKDVQAGYVWVNGSSTHFPGCSFGGVKNSGLGREEGVEELMSYTEGKFVNVML